MDIKTFIEYKKNEIFLQCLLMDLQEKFHNEQLSQNEEKFGSDPVNAKKTFCFAKQKILENMKFIKYSR